MARLPQRLRTKAAPAGVLLVLAALLFTGGRLWSMGDAARCTATPQFSDEIWRFDDTAAEPQATLVLVHGYHSDAAVWNDLLHQLQLSGSARVLRLCYQTRDEGSLAAGATGLATLLQGARPDPKLPLYLIGHSFGGLVVRQMLHDDAQRLYARWPAGSTLITIDTPHHGTPASYFRFLTGESILHLMSEEKEMRVVLWLRDNPTLRALEGGDYLDGMLVHTITGQYNASPFNAYLAGAMLGDSDGVVPSRSAHLDPLNRDNLPPESNHLGGSPFACAAGSGAGRWRYLFTAPIYRQDIFHTRINTQNAAVAQIVAAIIRGGGRVKGIDCVPYSPGLEGYGRRFWSLASMVAPVLLLAWVLRYVGLPAKDRRSRLLARLLARLRRLLPEPLPELAALPPYGLSAGYALLWGLTATLMAIIPSWGLTMAYYAAGDSALGQNMLPVFFVAAIALAEQAAVLWVFHRFLRHEQGTMGSDPEMEQECRSYGWLFGLITGVAEQAIVAISVGGYVAWSRAVFGIAERVGLGYIMGWLYGRLVVAVERPAWQEFTLALLPLVALHTAYAALFVHVLSVWEALIILASGLMGPTVIAYLAAVPVQQRRREGLGRRL